MIRPAPEKLNPRTAYELALGMSWRYLSTTCHSNSRQSLDDCHDIEVMFAFRYTRTVDQEKYDLKLA